MGRGAPAGVVQRIFPFAFLLNTKPKPSRSMLIPAEVDRIMTHTNFVLALCAAYQPYLHSTYTLYTHIPPTD